MIGLPSRKAWAVTAFSMLWLVLPISAGAQQQFFYGLSSRFELSDSVEVPQADADTLARLEQAKAFAADRQYDEAIEALRQVMEQDAGRVIAASDRRYTSVREYCHMRPGDIARRGASRSIAGASTPRPHTCSKRRPRSRSAARLRRLVDQYFASSVGDEALLALGDMALERGEHGEARSWWERLIPTPPQSVSREHFERVLADDQLPAGRRQELEKWYAADSALPPQAYWLRGDESLDDATRRSLVEFWNARGSTPNRLAYPDSDVDMAAIRARLVLVSILEGSLARAADELAGFKALHGEVRGRLGGLEVNYGDALTDLLAKAHEWPPAAERRDWPTFAGAMSRSHAAPVPLSPDVPLWSEAIQLPKAPVTDSFYPSPRVAETKNELLSYHPIVVGNLLAVNTLHEIRVYDVRTGRPAWGADATIFRPAEPVTERLHGTISTLGVPRFTLTAQDGFLYGRMGDPLTTRPEDNLNYRQPSYLVGLDLTSEGRLAWPPIRAEEKWAFEGSPVSDGRRVYVALRHGTRPQLHVASYDARTGRPLWRQFVASAETPARGQSGECTHNLLTLVDGVIYLNTNLGAVAALTADTGRPLWIVRYPRAKREI